MLRRLAVTLLAFGLAAPALAQEAPEGAYADFVPGADGEPFSTYGDTAPDVGLVTRIFALSFAETCSWAIGGDPEMRKPEVHELSFRYSFDEPDAPDHSLVLYSFFCNAGAYNSQQVYMLWDGDSGLRPVTFPQPTYSTELAEPDNPDSAVTAIQLTGFTSYPTVTNSEFDADTGTIISNACFRGVCDASSVGTWVLDGPEFRLQSFLVDPSYDGEQNLIELVNYAAPVDVPMTVVEPNAENSVTNN
jgi:hypothetical protein